MSDKDCVKTTDIKTAQSDNGEVKDVSKVTRPNASFICFVLFSFGIQKIELYRLH